MTRFSKPSWFLFLLVGATLLSGSVLIGCAPSNTQAGSHAPASSGLPVGRVCTVFMRHDRLGMASEHPASVLVDGQNGSRLSIAGRLKRADAEWIVLSDVGEKPPSEVWIPRDNVLAIRFLGESAGRADKAESSRAKP